MGLERPVSLRQGRCGIAQGRVPGPRMLLSVELCCAESMALLSAASKVLGTPQVCDSLFKFRGSVALNHLTAQRIYGLGRSQLALGTP